MSVETSTINLDYSLETELSLKIKSMMAVFGVIVTLIISKTLIKHFRNETNIPFSLKLWSLSIMILAIISNLQYSILNNNVIFSFIDKRSTFVDDYCYILYRIEIILFNSFKFCSWMFYLFRSKTFFQSTPLYLSRSAFYSFMIAMICSSFGFIYPLCIHSHHIILGASNNNQLRACSLAQTVQLDAITITSTVLDWFINILLLCLLYLKTKQLRLYQHANQQLSVHFSDRNRILININTKIMKRCILSRFIAMLITCIGTIIFVSYGNDIGHRLVFITDLLPILFSFDNQLCESENHHNHNNHNNPMRVHQHRLRIQLQDQVHLRRMMTAFREPAPPLNHANDDESDSESSVQIEGH